MGLEEVILIQIQREKQNFQENGSSVSAQLVSKVTKFQQNESASDQIVPKLRSENLIPFNSENVKVPHLILIF